MKGNSVRLPITDRQFYDILDSKLNRLNNRTKLYKLLKAKLLGMGYWKNKRRGRPMVSNLILNRGVGGGEEV